MNSGKCEEVGFSEWIDRPKPEKVCRASKKKKPLANNEGPLVGRHIELVEFLLANFTRKNIGYFLENRKGEVLGLLKLNKHKSEPPASEPDAFLKDADEVIGRLYLVPGVRLVAERKRFAAKIETQAKAVEGL